MIWFYISKGIEIYREKNSECVVAYSHFVPGLCGAILKALTKMKLIVEIVTSPDRCLLASKPKPTLADRIKQFFSEVSLQICVQCCDRAQLRAPGLLSPYPKLQSTPVSVFAGFVVVSLVPRHRQGDEQYILLVGAPWYLKGADTLIEAFKRLSGDFPEVRLKVLGFYPDSQQLEALIGGSPKIEVLKSRTNPEALELISRAIIFASPSRCEGSPRVVVEAMAAGVPVVGSDVGGIPYLVQDGQNGFVVPVGDAVALEGRLRQLLLDRELRERMGKKGYELAHTEFDESSYVRHFTRMVQETLTKEHVSPFHPSKNT
jgi:glycosyltransferase involved in cell wall biosynthesis